MARTKAPALSDVLKDLKRLREEIRRDLARLYYELGRINGDQHLVSIRAAARELGVRRSPDGALARAVRSGDLRTVQVGRRTKIRKTDLIRWVEAQAETRVPRLR
jgi:excisionase family DNA binding protein